MNCLFNISLKSLKTSKRKNLLVVLSIILSTCLITSIGIVSLSIQDRTVQLAIEQTGGNYHGRYDNVNKKRL
jgi:putative ABC transport system permease protein